MTRTEYPRPQFKRENWLNLNGKWQFTFDDQQEGQSAKWYQITLPNSHEIIVPFVFQSETSGINDQNVHDAIWYQRTFEIEPVAPDEQVILHFGAVDYQAKVYLNQHYIGQHIGGDNSFAFDITDDLVVGEQQLTVAVCDRTYDETIPHGKQSWTGKSEGIWYTNTTGIWQTVWVEKINKQHIADIQMTPDLDRTSIGLKIQVPDVAVGLNLAYQISFKGELVAKDQLLITSNCLERSVELFQQHIFRTEFHNDGWTWTPEHPNLFDIDFRLVDSDGVIKDNVNSYFGMRKVSTENGMIQLNNHPYYQRLVLDQGYWPTGLLTAPSDDAYKVDIEMAKKMGFNGCRKHQKIEDPRFLYWADKLGYLVWEEVASAPYYATETANRLIDAWQESVVRDYNHPAIIVWVPLNESWGVDRIHLNNQQQHFSEALYHMIHALDDSRLVESNDGWDNTATDIVAIHNYSHGTSADSKQYQSFTETLSHIGNLINQAPGKWDIFAKGFRYNGQPIVLSEFGGIGFAVNDVNGWGYTTASSSKDYLGELERVITPVAASKGLWGYCYTQLTDVEQEINGLLTYDRQPKADIKKINKIFDFDCNTPLSHKEVEINN
ncbi:glycoside hydrolase family 2 protein [Lapidilactobacillus gannanensis]|uniref:Glycoside hydrolase family 2 protein n=1 Tax=Lapidilactobacillus gannanensis TaxID=2486002 RepID=A0ABW4BJA0_9LACO|nr:sugar-binding domain-containing protein [Lapidilactobacillus gannanensis]